ncbi:MAG: hypothetical protein R8K54_08610 [Mariprofundaceae bacterium]
MVTNGKYLDVSQVTGKKELVRMLAKLRLRSDLEANSKGITEDIFDDFSDAEISALPESTIVHIADAYFILNKKGMPDQEIFKRIDMQRSLLGQGTSVPADMNLSKYIKWRLKYEFPQVASLEEMIVDMEILYAVKWFSRKSKSNQGWADADAFAARAISTMRGKHLDTQSMPEVEELIAKPSGVKWKWFIAGLMIVATAGAVAYWVFFMGGIEMFK